MTEPLPPLLGVYQHVHRDEGPRYTDSIEIGTPGRGGVIKVFGNLDDPEAFERRIREAFRLREIAQTLQERQQQGGATA